MRLDQFDKLQNLVKELEEMTRKLKQENYILNQENQKLKNQLSITKTNNFDLEEIEQLKAENNILKNKNNVARTRLNQLIGVVEKSVVHGNGE
jgi:FtsZ-binding cell division protein ZapB